MGCYFTKSRVHEATQHLHEPFLKTNRDITTNVSGNLPGFVGIRAFAHTGYNTNLKNYTLSMHTKANVLFFVYCAQYCNIVIYARLMLVRKKKF